MSPSLQLVLLLAFCLGQAHGALKLASYYNDHMVLQRGPQQAVLWGTADTEGDTVTAHVIGQGPAVTATVQHGKWKLKLPAITQPGPFVINVSASDGHVTLHDVLFGDVWLCSGQSNMEFNMHGVMNSTAEIQAGLSFKNIRFMKPLKVQSNTTLTDVRMNQLWTTPTATSLARFSAVCFLFAEYLQPHLNYPIGLVGTYWGGTTIEAWSPPEALAACPPSRHPHPSHKPQVLWNAMIAPLLPMTITGALWYQGESNSGLYKDYVCQIKALVSEWRAQFHQQSMGQTSDSFPFGYVQLADLTNTSSVGVFPPLRWAQTANHGYSPNPDLPHTFMAVAMDLPDVHSPFGAIHPRFKQQVSQRLVLGALNVAYGHKDVQFQGPFPSHFTPDTANHSLTIQYQAGTVNNLQIRNNHGFEVCCNTHIACDHAFTWVAAPITGHEQSHVTVDVSACASRGPVKGVRYEWRTTPCTLMQCAVYDSVNGLPAPSFLLETGNTAPVG